MNYRLHLHSEYEGKIKRRIRIASRLCTYNSTCARVWGKCGLWGAETRERILCGSDEKKFQAITIT